MSWAREAPEPAPELAPELTPVLSPPPTEVFEELAEAVQEKDALLSELHVRHIAIEQLFKNCAKLPWLHISRAGVKTSSRGGDGEGGAAAAGGAVLQRSGLT